MSRHRPASARTSADERPRRRVRRRRQVRHGQLGALAVALAAALAGLALAVQDATTAAPAGKAHPRAVRARLGAPATAGPARRSGKPVTLAFAGDIHFESPIRGRLATSPASVLAPVAPVLRRADVAVVNLETAVTARGTQQSKTYAFRAPAGAYDALEAGGVDVASLANNHGLDYGLTGLRDTLAAAKRARFPVVGAGWNDDEAYAPHRLTIRGQRMAIIGATQVLDNHLV
jgi:hypothetical protein